MPYSAKPVTREILLELIKPGQIYSPYNLGRKLHATSVDVKQILLSLVDEGKLKTIRPHKHQCFILPNTEHLRRGKLAPPKPDPETMAQPRTLSPLIGELTSYFAEISRRVDLAMMARPR
jgi:hypothetical protein